MKNNLIDKKHWDFINKNRNLIVASKDDQIRQWIEKYIPKGSGSCIEIGCYPGRYLAVFGELGYELHGIDFNYQTKAKLVDWFKERNYKLGKFKIIDFLEFRTEQEYKIVCSFGFLEHFNNWEEILDKHAGLVMKNGFLIITAPNFNGMVQKFLHLFLDKENYRRHNIAAIDPNLWSKHLMQKEFEIIYSGFFGKFDFWIEKQRRNFFQGQIANFILSNNFFLREFLPEHKAFSPYCGLIARKLSE